MLAWGKGGRQRPSQHGTLTFGIFAHFCILLAFLCILHFSFGVWDILPLPFFFTHLCQMKQIDRQAQALYTGGDGGGHSGRKGRLHAHYYVCVPACVPSFPSVPTVSVFSVPFYVIPCGRGCLRHTARHTAATIPPSCRRQAGGRPPSGITCPTCEPSWDWDRKSLFVCMCDLFICVVGEWHYSKLWRELLSVLLYEVDSGWCVCVVVLYSVKRREERVPNGLQTGQRRGDLTLLVFQPPIIWYYVTINQPSICMPCQWQWH